ncbi:glucosamine-6-phosphate deaminase [Halalkalibacter krulwichiae]|uniref:Glucosamine-6-phosphate deaminase 1 n=1 Tax=Halalkalibacter krulwichiae TaxID=199441 RepID=A0A1X9MG79_9BACI|nr:glucosamine-6-phosphate deaminase [Halalkalibacter krulwichiae]ARK32426.1 Glucosamine-6-phosphate deaminase 1 [Halalkalibacter krulwichiae]
MKIFTLKDAEQLGKEAAEYAAELLNGTIQNQGEARLLFSTGQSQLTTINELVKKDIDWSKVEMFHLDEYVDLSEEHKASFRKYLKERFVNKINLKKAYFVGEGEIEANIQSLTEEIRKAPIDVALIGIGENAHIAFNDPPADFETKEAYIKVQLDDTCKNQQVREGWFSSIEEVPNEAITMTIHQILQSKHIISCVPYAVKAEAIKNTLEHKVDNTIPATILKEHRNWTLYLDEESASLIK